MIRLGLAASLALLFLLLLVRAALNGLSAMTLNRMAEEEVPSAATVRAYLHRRLAYLLTLQFSVLVLSIGATLLLTADLVRSKAAQPLLWGFVASLLSVLVLASVAQAVAALDPERVFLATLPVVRAFLWVFGIVTVPLASLLSRRLHVLRERMDDEDEEEEISALINVGQSEGILEKEDSVLIRGVMEFGDTVAREVMTPRTDMVSAPANTPLTAAAELLAKARHTRLPLYEEQIDDIVGVAYLKDFLGALLAGEGGRPVREFARPVPFVPENKPISQLLREFQEQKLQLAIVVDEYGGVDGLVTTEDLLEEIVGEIQEYDEAEEEPFVDRAPGVVETLGRASVYDLAERLGVDIPEGDYDSVAGWISTALGTIPRSGDRFTIHGLEVEVLSADRRRIHRVRVTRPQQAEEGKGEGS
ncbi:MAG: hemolysin family protein [Acidobacteriota bacterium]